MRMRVCKTIGRSFLTLYAIMVNGALSLRHKKDGGVSVWMVAESVTCQKWRQSLVVPLFLRYRFLQQLL